jgi:hypothetical protein
VCWLFQVDKIIDQIHGYISSYDAVGLTEYWSMLEQYIFVHVDQSQMPAVNRLRTSVQRVCLVTAIQAGRGDRVTEFFDKLMPHVHSQPDWKDWLGNYLFVSYDVELKVAFILPHFLVYTVFCICRDVADFMNWKICNSVLSRIKCCNVISIADVFTVLRHSKNPEENTTFALYFSRQWQDTLFLSLHNFISIILSTMRIL